MRITITSIGTRGDVQPMLALALGLQNKGHDVLFATHEIFEEFVTLHGLPFYPLSGNPQELVQSDAGIHKMLEAHRDPMIFMKELKKVGEEFGDAVKKDVLGACENAEAILFSPLAFLAMDVAEYLDVPLIGVGLQPLTPTGKYQPMMIPMSVNPGYFTNYILHLIILRTFYGFSKPIINKLRKELGLPPYGFLGPFWKSFWKKEIPVIYGYSDAVLPRPSDWPEQHHLTGYWFLDEKEEYIPPQNLVDFINNGPKPIYIGFGSMSPRDPEATTKLIIKALESIEQRAVMLSGWAGLDAENLPDTIYKIDSIPHDWLFPQMAAVVHHGGAGTTAAGIRAGVPAIISPFFSDQPFWGQRVEQLGIGPAPIPQKKLTSERLANAIQKVMDNEVMQRRAKELGEQIAQENGVEIAIQFIEKHIT